MHQKQGKLLVKKVSLNTRLTFNHMSNLRSSIFEYLTFGHQISDISTLVVKQILQRNVFFSVCPTSLVGKNKIFHKF